MTEAPPTRHLKGKVALTEALGSEIMVHFSIDAKPAATEDMEELQRDIGDDREAGAVVGAESGGAVIVGRFNPRSRVHEGDTVDVAVDTRSLHFSIPRAVSGSTTNPPERTDHMSRLRMPCSLSAPRWSRSAALATTASGASHKHYAVSGNLSMVGIWTGPEQKNFQAVLDAFQKKFPGVKVKYTSAGDNTPTVSRRRSPAATRPMSRRSGSPASYSSSRRARRSSPWTSSSP